MTPLRIRSLAALATSCALASLVIAGPANAASSVDYNVCDPGNVFVQATHYATGMWTSSTATHGERTITNPAVVQVVVSGNEVKVTANPRLRPIGGILSPVYRGQNLPQRNFMPTVPVFQKKLAEGASVSFCYRDPNYSA